MTEFQWFVSRNNRERFGPYDSTQLKELAEQGNVLPTDMLKRSDLPKWQCADSVPGLFEPVKAVAVPLITENLQPPVSAAPIATPVQVSHYPGARPQATKGTIVEHKGRRYQWDGVTWAGVDDYTIPPMSVVRLLDAQFFGAGRSDSSPTIAADSGEDGPPDWKICDCRDKVRYCQECQNWYCECCQQGCQCEDLDRLDDLLSEEEDEE